MRLKWDSAAGLDGAGAGMADTGSMKLRLAGAPDLAFAFDAIDYDDTTTSTKTLAGDVMPLTDDEAAAVDALLRAYHPT